MLFHYHFWTPHLEETEKFYEANGFKTYQRLGKYGGKFQLFNPPLTWDDFRDKNLLFRIIEMRNGNVNITFGYGKKVIFDHIGLIVSEKQHEQICKNANALNWETAVGNRRTFISTPYHFRIELQTRFDVLDNSISDVRIAHLTISSNQIGLDESLTKLFGKPINGIESVLDENVTIKKAIILGFPNSNVIDPNGVCIFNEE